MRRAQAVCFTLLTALAFASGLDLVTIRAVTTPNSEVCEALVEAGRSSPTTNCVSVPSGLVSWWPFDGNANDFQLANNAFSNGGSAYLAGIVAQALDFDGGDDF